jgi:hypothetical protein
MLVPEFYCVWKHKLKSWAPRSAQSIKTASEYQAAFWCYKCRVIRYLIYWKCQICGYYIAPDHYAKHRRDCEIELKHGWKCSACGTVNDCGPEDPQICWKCLSVKGGL